jgi:hypothetical protein
VSYNNFNNAVVYRYTTAWVLFQTYITGSLIVQNTITGDKVAANTITGTNIAGTTITAANIAANTITASQIAANTITASEIASATISAGNMAANSITAANAAIADAAITTAKIGNLQVETAQIGNNAVTTAAYAGSNGFTRFYSGFISATTDDIFSTITFSANAGDIVLLSCDWALRYATTGDLNFNGTNVQQTVLTTLTNYPTIFPMRLEAVATVASTGTQTLQIRGYASGTNYSGTNEYAFRKLTLSCFIRRK